ncbi:MULTISPECIES: class I SAM-dependent methyltransferase [unclassified Clostridium]|uniref:class I SAM-dependent methyltransferase n=1 Tax=unclassified Clostridium TaxID=2614128 RepID=UPI0002978B5C|nr:MULTISPECIES: class I SAM-dependent methyltransferase [unclassified Clostridium]EKQ58325.1 MAG: methylase involved in ubiquinone/menaquinone biosynthesis [Clostridium sp. Maddingley MBC34-26]
MELKWEDEYDSLYEEQWEDQIGVLPTAKVAADIFDKNDCKIIMDLGCGKGRHTVYFAQQEFNVFATDISETAIAETKARIKELEFKNVQFRQHDMREIPFDDNYFDGVLCVWTTGVGTLEDCRRHINEIHRVLKTNGIVIIDYVSTSDKQCGIGDEIEKNTYINNIKGEEDIPYHYSTKEELEELYSSFSGFFIKPVDYNFFDRNGGKYTIEAFVVIAVK